MTHPATSLRPQDLSGPLALLASILERAARSTVTRDLVACINQLADPQLIHTTRLCPKPSPLALAFVNARNYLNFAHRESTLDLPLWDAPTYEAALAGLIDYPEAVTELFWICSDTLLLLPRDFPTLLRASAALRELAPLDPEGVLTLAGLRATRARTMGTGPQDPYEVVAALRPTLTRLSQL